MSLQIYCWLHIFKHHNTLTYLFTLANSLEEARERIISKSITIKDTTKDNVYAAEGVEYYYKSSPLGAAEGVLHLGSPDSMTTEEVCYLTNELKTVLSKNPDFIGPADSVGFVTAKFHE